MSLGPVIRPRPPRHRQPQQWFVEPEPTSAVAISYLFSHRPQWPEAAGVGRTVVSSGSDRSGGYQVGVAPPRSAGRIQVVFVDGLLDGSLAFGGEESAGASFLRRDGTVWTTDKDGMIMGLLAAEMTAVMGRDAGEFYRSNSPVSLASPSTNDSTPRRRRSKIPHGTALTATGHGHRAGGWNYRYAHDGSRRRSIGGLKVTTANGWFAARPSGTEDVYKIYARELSR